MSDEIINGGTENELSEKELLQKRREEQAERLKMQYETDKEQKRLAEIRIKQEEELEKELAPLYSARKFCGVLCGLMWAFAAFCLVTGTLEMKIFLSMAMFVLCSPAAVSVPIFLKKGKLIDSIVSAVCAVACFTIGAIILMLG